jgi:hypothetical protein
MTRTTHDLIFVLMHHWPLSGGSGSTMILRHGSGHYCLATNMQNQVGLFLALGELMDFDFRVSYLPGR